MNSMKGKMSRKRSSGESDETAGSLGSKRHAVWDPYCWLCHQSNTNCHCTTCIRSYHDQCIGLKESKQNPYGYRCELCIRMEAAKNDYNDRDMEKFHKMLACITDDLSQDVNFKKLGAEFNTLRKPVKPSQPAIINPFDLSIVLEKVEESRYKTTLEFLNDIKWIRHNAEIVLKKNDERLEIARNMEERCEKEVYDIEMCSECFYRANTKHEWFTRVCDPPHLLVWARLKGHPYWPAKVFGIGDVAQKKVDVRFFGKHEMGKVTPSDCLLFTEQSPNKTLDKNEANKLAAALKEANKYILNLEDKYSCDFVMYDSHTGIDVNKIGNHLKSVIPGISDLPKNYKLKQKPDYLKKTRCRKAVELPRVPEQNNLMGSIVRLIRCDHLLNKDQLHELHTEWTVEPAEVIDDQSTEQPWPVETMEIESLTVEAMTVEPMTIESTATQPVDELMADELVADELVADEPVEVESVEEVQVKVEDKDEFEAERYRRMLEHMKNYDLVINLVSDNESECDSGYYHVISSDTEDEADQKVPNAEIANRHNSNEYVLVQSDEANASKIDAESNEPQNHEEIIEIDLVAEHIHTEQIDNEQDEEEFIVQKAPHQRTYEKRQQKKASNGQLSPATSSSAIDADDEYSGEGKMVARKSYVSPHNFNFAIRRSPTEVVTEVPTDHEYISSGAETQANEQEAPSENANAVEGATDDDCCHVDMEPEKMHLEENLSEQTVQIDIAPIAPEPQAIEVDIERPVDIQMSANENQDIVLVDEIAQGDETISVEIVEPTMAAQAENDEVKEESSQESIADDLASTEHSGPNENEVEGALERTVGLDQAPADIDPATIVEPIENLVTSTDNAEQDEVVEQVPVENACIVAATDVVMPDLTKEAPQKLATYNIQSKSCTDSETLTPELIEQASAKRIPLTEDEKEKQFEPITFMHRRLSEDQNAEKVPEPEQSEPTQVAEPVEMAPDANNDAVSDANIDTAPAIGSSESTSGAKSSLEVESIEDNSTDDKTNKADGENQNTLVEKALIMLQQSASKKMNDTRLLRDEIKKKDELLQKKDEANKELESQVKHLRALLVKKDEKIAELELKIQEPPITESVVLCVVCKKVANAEIYQVFQPPTCSIECLRTLCPENDQMKNADQNASNVIYVPINPQEDQVAVDDDDVPMPIVPNDDINPLDGIAAMPNAANAHIADDDLIFSDLSEFNEVFL